MNAYDTFISEIRDMIAPHLKADLDAERFAKGIADEINFFEEHAHFEIRGFHTNTGNPITFDVDIPASLKETVDE